MHNSTFSRSQISAFYRALERPETQKFNSSGSFNCYAKKIYKRDEGKHG